VNVNVNGGLFGNDNDNGYDNSEKSYNIDGYQQQQQ